MDIELSDFADWQWDGHRWVHTPKGRMCQSYITPLVTGRMTETLILMDLHSEQCK